MNFSNVIFIYLNFTAEQYIHASKNMTNGSLSSNEDNVQSENEEQNADSLEKNGIDLGNFVSMENVGRNMSSNNINIKLRAENRTKKRYAYNNLNEKEIKIIKSNFCAACDEIQKYVRNMLINKKQYILEEEDFKYFSDKENQILIFKINKIRSKAFVSTKCIYAIWRSKVSDILNKASLVLYSILPEIISFK
ncbi:hypothetical protein CWI38_0359p0030 [Hamiltosporidium tvaerminnensis]|uniref:Uncharacterized protein n=1 Tax=Hamiltosporidium tvaerminnensis TaxID=1176355 RepID=A0A4Q9LZ65_9MICR|nr:hypothetical protein CWI38_0359p0030 [Hamiltosporidium tvaerminnensis]